MEGTTGAFAADKSTSSAYRRPRFSPGTRPQYSHSARPLPLHKAPTIGCEGAFFIPKSLTKHIHDLGFTVHEDEAGDHPDCGLIMLESKISLEVLQAILTSPHTKELSPDQFEDDDSTDEMACDSSLEEGEVKESPLKRKRK